MAKKRKRRKQKVQKHLKQKRKWEAQPIIQPDVDINDDYIETPISHEEGTWVLCAFCERCYQVGEERQGIDGHKYCHYSDCNDFPIEVYRWDSVRSVYPEYPEVPERGKVYICEADLWGA